MKRLLAALDAIDAWLDRFSRNEKTPYVVTVYVLESPICGGSKCSPANGCGVGKPCPFIKG